MRLLVVVCFLFLPAFSGEDLVGTRAPEWRNQQWINSPPLTLSGLKGKVVLLRFFMDSSCPLCRETAPYLNLFHEKYKDKGLMVLGMYTPKPAPRETSSESVRRYTRDYGFQFPVALDNDWATLRLYWLDRVSGAEYTSVSFLIDKKGIIRYIHPGGAYSSKDAVTIQKLIEKLIES